MELNVIDGLLRCLTVVLELLTLVILPVIGKDSIHSFTA